MKKSSLVAAVVAAASLTAQAQNARPQLPRGMNVDPLAGNCNIGTFPQTSKAGPYNQLCHIMQDPEKCLGAIKRQFFVNGDTGKISPVYSGDAPRMAYCLDVLRQELLRGTEEE